MNKRKGVEVTNVTTMAILAITVAGLTIAGSSNMVSMYEVGLEDEVTKMVSARVASGVHAIDSYPRGKLEMNLRTEYKIEPAENGEAVNVSSGGYTDEPDAVFEVIGREPQSRASSVNSFYSDAEVNFESFTASNICVTKKEDAINLKGGEC